MTGESKSSGGPKKTKGMTTDDELVWRTVAQSVKPLTRQVDFETFMEMLDPPPPKSAPALHPSLPDVPINLKPQVKRPLPDLAVGHMPGLDKRTSQRVTKGAFKLEGRLDLHGMTRDQAQSRLVGYVEQAYAQGKRTILVITGKGEAGSGVLKAEVPRWLNISPLREKILGFSHAQPKDGGEGALYVLIKRQRL